MGGKVAIVQLGQGKPRENSAAIKTHLINTYTYTIIIRSGSFVLKLISF